MLERALHFVFKVADRTATVKFCREILGMKVLRHEEFSSGCEATCNGPYDNPWSKTMIGYGPEENHFVLELTYNYGIKEYKQGNDFQGITIRSKEIIERAKQSNWPIEECKGKFLIKAPGGYNFYIINEPQPTDKDPMVKVTLSSSNLQRTIDYWDDILELQIFERTDKSVLLGYEQNQVKVEFVDIGTSIDHATAYGRIAFSMPFVDQPELQQKIVQTNHKILTNLRTLLTRDKPSVRVLILADPDGHEICFVDDAGFRNLSFPDYKSEEILNKAMASEMANST